jgi:bifunctional pyridoxal-dependent enzyme with beta-cystathionase and maltose regulon repressor activities
MFCTIAPASRTCSSFEKSERSIVVPFSKTTFPLTSTMSSAIIHPNSANRVRNLQNLKRKKIKKPQKA